MTRPDDNYGCGKGCGCTDDVVTDPEEDNDGYPDDMPLDVTPGERHLWAIFGHRPPNYDEEQSSEHEHQ